MSALDNLPPDQRAVLQMVLQRGRSYDEIAALLSIDRAAVRRRALDAFDTLAPATVLPGPESALITDYLLGQLPARVAEQVYAYLQASDADRAWAEALAALLGPLASGSLPEIPVGAPLGADDGPAGGLEQISDPSAEAGAQPQPELQPPSTPELAGAAAVPVERASDAGARSVARTSVADARAPRRSSRRGGAILLGAVGMLIVAVVLVVALSGGGGSKPSTGGTHTGSGAAAQNGGRAGTTSTGSGATQTKRATTTTGATGTTTTATTGASQILAQLNLTSPSGARSPLGIAQVVRVGGSLGIILYAQGLPANTAHNAYALWLYNSPTSYRMVGFVQYLVGKNGTLDTSGHLAPWVAGYHRLLITLETQPKPHSPGEVVLSGPFREHP